MTKAEKLKLRIRKMEFNVEKRIDLIVEKVQSKCKHDLDDVREIPMKNKDWLGVDVPFRVCVNCGLAEKGWSFQTLAKNVYSKLSSLDRETGYSNVVKWIEK